MAAATAKYMCNVKSCWSGRSEMRMSANTLNIWLSKFVCEVAKQNGELYPPISLYLLIFAINRHLSETGGEDAFTFLNKADKRQVNCYVF